MQHAQRSLYAVDPETDKVRLVVQVEPKGWSDEALETTLSGIVPILGSAGISVALLVGETTSYLVRRTDNESHFEVDEIETSEVLAPLERGKTELFDIVEQWFRAVAERWQEFVPQTKLAKRIPEIVPLIVGAELRAREGAIGMPG